jgi:hypothetical protein
LTRIKGKKEAVSDLIKRVNVKEILFLDDASGVLVKQIKPNFKTLGPFEGYGADFQRDTRFFC